MHWNSIPITWFLRALHLIAIIELQFGKSSHRALTLVSIKNKLCLYILMLLFCFAEFQAREAFVWATDAGQVVLCVCWWDGGWDGRLGEVPEAGAHHSVQLSATSRQVQQGYVAPTGTHTYYLYNSLQVWSTSINMKPLQGIPTRILIWQGTSSQYLK